jgi:hypothetical protein
MRNGINTTNKPKQAAKALKIFAKLASKNETKSGRLRIIRKDAAEPAQNVSKQGEMKKGEHNGPPAESKR